MAIPVDKYSVICTLLVFLVLLVRKLIHKKEIQLEDVVVAMIAGSMIPVAITMVLYPFIPSLISSLEEMSLQIAFMGFILLFVYGKIIISKVFSDSS